MKRWYQVALSGVIALSCANGAWAHAQIFSEHSLAQAKEQAQKDKKLLLIDFTATWCPPCRKMEVSTWADSSVQNWIKENAIAIQIDVDKDGKSSQALNVQAMPTIVLFTPESGAKEFGRQVGFMDAGQLLDWLKAAQSGKTAEQVEKEQKLSGGEEVWTRIAKARQAQAAGKQAEALEEYIWLWNNIPEGNPNLGPVRKQMVPYELKRLCAAYPAGKAKITEMRDAAEKGGNRHDWIVMNSILDDNPSTLAWFDKAKADPAQLEIVCKNSDVLEPIVFSSMRYADAANIFYADPIARVNKYYKTAQDMRKPRPDTAFSKDFDPFPGMVMLMYGSYVGARRDADAKKIYDECLRLDDTPAMREGLDNMAKGIKQMLSLQSQTDAKTKPLNK